MNAVKDFVGGVVSTDNLDVTDGTRRKSDGLPALAHFVPLVDDSVPLEMIRRHVDVVRVRTRVTIPEQKTNASDVIWLGKLNDDCTLNVHELESDNG